SINFCPPAQHFLTSGIILDCKMFQQSMSGFPSDRHAYQLKCFMHPMMYCFSSSSSFYKFFNKCPDLYILCSVREGFPIKSRIS
ncbi:MAG: hypothetical protein ACK53Y_19220, partial [bacterium]